VVASVSHASSVSAAATTAGVSGSDPDGSEAVVVVAVSVLADRQQRDGVPQTAVLGFHISRGSAVRIRGQSVATHAGAPAFRAVRGPRAAVPVHVQLVAGHRTLSPAAHAQLLEIVPGHHPAAPAPELRRGAEPAPPEPAAPPSPSSPPTPPQPTPPAPTAAATPSPKRRPIAHRE